MIDSKPGVPFDLIQRVKIWHAVMPNCVNDKDEDLSTVKKQFNVHAN